MNLLGVTGNAERVNFGSADSPTTSRGRLAALRRNVRAALECVRRCRTNALDRKRAGARFIERERNACEYADARRDLQRAADVLAYESRKPVVKHGGKWSPAAVARNFPDNQAAGEVSGGLPTSGVDVASPVRKQEGAAESLQGVRERGDVDATGSSAAPLGTFHTGGAR